VKPFYYNLFKVHFQASLVAEIFSTPI